MTVTLAGSPRHRENRENGPKKTMSGKTQGILKFCQNTGNLVCASCKFPDSKDKGYFDICRENVKFFLKAGKVCQVSFVCVIVINFPDSKVKRYFDICRENIKLFLKAGKICQVRFVCVIVINHVNWPRERLWSDGKNRENTGNYKMQFEWVP